MGRAKTFLLLIFASIFCNVYAAKEVKEIVVQVPDLGYIKGRTVETLGNLGKPKKSYHNFRNIPFAKSVSNQYRFSAPRAWDTILGTEENPYDATKSGPLCPQLGLDSKTIDHYVDENFEVALGEILNETVGSWTDLFDLHNLIDLLEALLEVDLYGRLVDDVLQDLIDVNLSVDEDCLHLAVSTPNIEPAEPLPVMVFIYGGGFKAGTQMKMGEFERLGEANQEVVLVAMNYRLGHLGFMCLPSDEAAGNMGLLDQIMALRWVQDNIASFGGDPSRVTLFGQSAGAASSSHLMLSPLTEGLFHQVILQSGSALAPWAYDDINSHEYHTRKWAALVGCTEPDLTDMIACLKTISISEITAATGDYLSQAVLEGGMGFEGANPCGQTHGAEKLYPSGLTPTEILLSGNYTKVPLMAGACQNDGTLFLAMFYSGRFFITGEAEDAHWLKYRAMEETMRVVKIEGGYAFKRDIQDAYFYPNEMGNFQAMTRGMTDLIGVIGLKASTYKIVEENARWGANSYFYSLEPGAQSEKKSLYHLESIGDSHKPFFTSLGASHSDDLLFLFNMNLPVVVCDLKSFLVGLSLAWTQCIYEVGLADSTQCLTDPQGSFKTNYGECLFGSLTESEMKLSDIMVEAWTNFATYGNPSPNNTATGANLLPHWPTWSDDQPYFLRFGLSKTELTTLDAEYTKTYSTKPFSSRDLFPNFVISNYAEEPIIINIP